MVTQLFLLLMFVPAALVAGLTVLVLRLRPPRERPRGFPVLPLEDRE